jgi:hypothetical protein
MKKQTAVEWMVEQVELISNNKTLSKKDAVKLYDEVIQKAKAMEMEQIEDAWDKRCSHGVVSQTWHIETKNGEQYYNEKYGGDNV